MRTSFVGFWKSTAIFQFGVCAVFLAPILFHNENQPDPSIRMWQAIGSKPFLSIDFLPFLKLFSGRRWCHSHGSHVVSYNTLCEEGCY